MKEEIKKEIIKKIWELSVSKDETSLGCNQFLLEERIVGELEDFIIEKLDKLREQTYKQGREYMVEKIEKIEEDYDKDLLERIWESRRDVEIHIGGRRELKNQIINYLNQ